MADFGTLNFAVAFNPQTAFPLDARTLFYSLEEAKAAAATAQRAGSSSTVYYFGMKIVVVDESAATARQYVIQPGGRLLAIATTEDIGSEGGGVSYNIGSGLTLDSDTNTLSVDTAEEVVDGDLRPVSCDAIKEYVDAVVDDSLGEVSDALAEV